MARASGSPAPTGIASSRVTGSGRRIRVQLEEGGHIHVTGYLRSREIERQVARLGRKAVTAVKDVSIPSNHSSLLLSPRHPDRQARPRRPSRSFRRHSRRRSRHVVPTTTASPLGEALSPSSRPSSLNTEHFIRSPCGGDISVERLNRIRALRLRRLRQGLVLDSSRESDLVCQ